MNLDGKIALVTGASRGIGHEIARGLARAGARVLMVGRDPERLEAARAGLAGEGLDVLAFAADVADAAAVDDLVAALPGGLDVLVNNAGQIDPAVSTWDLPVEAWDDVIASNLRGPFLLCRAAVPLMRARGWGRIVNVSSGMGAFADGLDGGHPAYRVSKAGLNALTKNLAAELSGQPILVNVMCPGWVRTDMGGAGAPRSVEEGADTAIFLATLPDGGPSGKFWRDRAEIPW
ncbi:MAG: short-chain dehydrogenase/reductase [Cyanobacteria bacterium RYN_339]|nr:short-chain dehydrogenase/reductase [Cyanobacteria bacterium RYN_339]